MLESLKKFLKDVFTENDGQSGDMVMVAAFAGFGTFLGLAIFVVVAKGAAFNMVEYGAAYGTMLTGLGFAYKLKLDAQTKASATPEAK